jgi:hypothetical protein
MPTETDALLALPGPLTAEQRRQILDAAFALEEAGSMQDCATVTEQLAARYLTDRETLTVPQVCREMSVLAWNYWQLGRHRDAAALYEVLVRARCGSPVVLADIGWHVGLARQYAALGRKQEEQLVLFVVEEQWMRRGRTPETRTEGAADERPEPRQPVCPDRCLRYDPWPAGRPQRGDDRSAARRMLEVLGAHLPVG